MKCYVWLTIILTFWVVMTQGQTITKTIGPSADYITLKLAFDAINKGTIKGDITLQINGNTTEIATAILNASGSISGSNTSSYTKITIYPIGTGYTISGNLAAPLIDLNGADNVTIDGRLNATGSNKDLAIKNLNTSGTSNTSSVRFINSAENNIIQYATISGGSTGVFSGVLLFGSASKGNGNSGNKIDHCNLTGLSATSRPVYVFYSNGSTGFENKNNTVSNNNIYDFFNSSLESYGIYVFSNSLDWNITDNSFYEKTSFINTNSVSNYCIRVKSTTGSNFEISGNYIGGQSASCGGSPWNMSSTQSSRFYAIYLDVGTSSPSCSVQGNSIKNFDVTNTNNIPWMGINVNSGSVNIGTLNGNTIGETTGTGSITLTNPANNSTSYGIYVNSTGTVNASNNSIGSMTTVGASGATPNSHSLVGIYKASTNTGDITINNNLIGSLSTPNSLQASSVSGSSTAQNVYGIYSTGTGTNTISNNTVANLSNAYDYQYSTNGQTTGIYTTSGVNTIQNNTIRDLSAVNGCNDPNGNAAVIGISQRSNNADQNISGNTIYNLSSLYTGARPVSVIGIYFAGGTTGTNSISGNFIYGLSVASTATPNSPAILNGIKLSSGNATTSNNIVSLGVGMANPCNISGIYENGANGENNNGLGNNNIWFNSVYIGGVVSGATASTYALYSNANTNTRDFRNNILFNARSGGTTGKHYAIQLAGNTNLSLDYNDYFANGTGGVLGVFGGSGEDHNTSSDKTTLALWKTATGKDVNSLNINPLYASTGGISALNYFATSTLPGIAMTGILTDFTNNTRGGTPKMGALETNNYVWQGGISSDFNIASNWSGNLIPPNGADFAFAANPSHDCNLDQNRTFGNITIAQGIYKMVVNGKQLTIKGNLNFTNSAQINATASSSVVVFAGSNAQNIPTGSFVSNTIDGLTLNNSSGLTLAGDLTVAQTFTLTNGAFTIRGNTLTLNGPIATTSGNLVGGGSSNIVIGGIGASSILPTVSLNNLTLNRTNGLNLGGNVSIAGTLALTTGTLTLGANTLTISKYAPTKSSGNIDASNVGATLVFENTTAITLPDLFSNYAINNLTINKTFGVTAGSDITVNGVLNLAAANPSPTKGLLEMTREYGNYPGFTVSDFLKSWILNMGATATTIGTGDVTGTVKRATIVVNTPYTFGNQNTALSLNAGTMPTALSVTITIGKTAPGPSETDKIRDAIQRTYEIISTGGSGSSVTANFHYLDAELKSSLTSNLNSVLKMTTTDYDIMGAINSDEHGRANYDYTNRYIGFSGVPISYFILVPGTHEWRTIFTLRDYGESYNTWNGSISTDWNIPANWTLPYGGSGIPTETSHVIIPDVTNTNNRSPILPSGVTTINTISIENGGILTMGNNTLTIQNSLSGGWEDQNSLGNDPGTSKVIFTRPNTAISGIARFYDVEIGTGADISNQGGSTMKIAHTITKTGSGKWYANIFGATIEYNGVDQTIVLPDGNPHYHNLILSGSGTKTMPASPLLLHGNFTLVGTASATMSAAMTIGGDVTIGSGSIFNTGNYDHLIAGNIKNNGTFTATDGHTITMNGDSLQSLKGSPTFGNLTINNNFGVSLSSDVTVKNILTLTDGNLNVGAYGLAINGTISKTAGYIKVNSGSSLSFGGSGAMTITNDLFTLPLSINNLTINKAGGVTLGNVNLTVNGLLNLQSGTLGIGANKLTIAGSSLIKASGFIDAGNASATLEFTNSLAITLPSSLFNGNVNNLTINGSGGVTSSDDITINGILNLQSTNPTSIKGSFDMMNGSLMKTLTMGATATTVGMGDVTGIIRRTSFVENVPYSFGNQFTTINMHSGGTLPTSVSVKVILTSDNLSWKSNAIHRYYDIIKTGDNNTTLVTLNLHYLNSELNNATETDLALFNNNNSTMSDQGQSNSNISDNWVGLANLNLTDIVSGNSFGVNYLTLGTSTAGNDHTWIGTYSTEWNLAGNWSVEGIPDLIAHVHIPTNANSLFNPTLPNATTIGKITIDLGGVLNGGTTTMLTLSGDAGTWENLAGESGFNAGTSTVIFNNAKATIADHTNFNNVTVANGATLTLGTENIMRIAGTLSLLGTLNAASNHNMVEFNGVEQTIPNPNGSTPGYDNLILSGTGIKTLPANALSITGDLSFEGKASATAGNSITVSGNTNIGTGSKFATGAYSHSMPNLTIETGGNLTISGGGILTVGNNLTNNSGTAGLIIRSTSNAAIGTGSLLCSSSGVEATVERWMSKNVWHLISPVTTGQTISDFVGDPANKIAINSPRYGLAPYNEMTNSWDYFVTSGANGSFSDVGKGYEVLRTEDGIVTFKGMLASNDQTITIDKTVSVGYGWNLIGNPYPCAIDISAFLANTANTDAIDPSHLGIYVSDLGSSDGGYSLINKSNASLKLSSGEAFFVKSVTAWRTVNITRAMKSSTSDAFKSSAVDWPEIKLFAETGTQKLSTSVKYIAGMTKGLDPGWDGGLFNGNTPSFSLFTRLVQDNGVDFTIQCLPDNKYDSLVVPVGLVAKQGSNVTFRADVINLPSGYKVYLEDRVVGKFTRLDEAGSFYSVMLNAENTGTGRFYLYTKELISAIPDKLTDGLKVIPLPEQEIIRILGTVHLPARAKIYDMSGKIISTMSLTGLNENVIPFNKTNSGVYLLRIESDKRPITKKISWIRN